MQFLELVHGRLLGGPADDETLGIGCCRFGDNVEVDVVDLLMSDATVVLYWVAKRTYASAL